LLIKIIVVSLWRAIDVKAQNNYFESQLLLVT